MTIVLVALLLYIVHHTKPGLAMRAISKDIETTRLLGVRVDNIIAFKDGNVPPNRVTAVDRVKFS